MKSLISLLLILMLNAPALAALTSPPTISGGTTGATIGNTLDALRVQLRNTAGAETGTNANPLRTDPTGTTTQPVSQVGTWTVQQGTPPWSVSQSGAWTTGRTWSLLNTTDSVNSVQSGTWTTGRTWSLSGGTDSINAIQGTSPWVTSRNWALTFAGDKVDVSGSTVSVSAFPTIQDVNLTKVAGTAVSTGTGTGGAGIPRVTVSSDSSLTNISGTISLPTGAATSALQTTGNSSLSSIDSKTPALGQAVMASSVPVVIASNQSAVPVSQSGTWTTGRTWSLLNSTDSVNAVQSGTWTTGRTWSLSSGSDSVTASQSGTWTTGRTWSLASGTDSIAAVQSGTWNINNISGTVSLPTGASTSALQTTGNSSLSSIDGKLNSLGQKTMANSVPVTLASDQSALMVVTNDTAPANQTITVVDSATTTLSGANSQPFYTGTPTTNSAATYALASQTTVNVQANILGGGGTLVVEESTDGGTFWFRPQVLQIGTSTYANAFTAPFSATLPVAGITNFRVRAITSWSGTATIIVKESLNTRGVTVADSLPTGTNSIGQVTANAGTNLNTSALALDTSVQTTNTDLGIINSNLTNRNTFMKLTDGTRDGTIKAASTAAGAADTSLVVALSPNSPVPTGSNVIGAVTQSGVWTVQPGNTPNTTPWVVTVVDGQKTTYSATITALVGAATATDIFTLTGSATKTVRINHVEISGTQTTSAVRDVLLLRRSTANTGGTSTNPTRVSHDSTNAAATATVNAYTVNPTLGTLVGTIRTGKLDIESTNLVGGSDHLIFDFGTRPGQAIVLRGIAEVFAVNLNGVTSAGNSMDVAIEWTEE